MDTKLLSYAELGEALGITAASAKRLSNRRKWAKTQGNDGLARVIVPVERLNAPRPTPKDIPGDNPEDAPPDAPRDSSEDTFRDISGDARALIAVLESRVSELQGRVAELDAEARQGRAALARVDVLEALLDTERKRIEEIRETEKQRVEEWKAVADRFAAQAEQMVAAQARRGWWPWRRRA